ncbi:MAG: UDP-N-acetylmuramoyl-tripeptide--D-alanyl-D-alanine ligase, partial [Chloroflexota bacterium]|nr:UDP-N-acetylmuramoyl-tripeptide--D-alanyl-D-alanine ligase [Chloroflexota bacterium]
QGSLFIALPGKQSDGHDYVQNAFENGAVLAFVNKPMPDQLQTLDLRQKSINPEQINLERPLCLIVEEPLKALQTIAAYWRVKHPVCTIGITGSVGKTTTKELTASLLSQKFNVLKNPGNRNNEIGLPLTLLELEESHEYAVLEMGFYVPGEIRTLCEIAKPQLGVLTNIGTVHAERAGSQETIAKGKAELVEMLPPGPEGVAVLNMDDSYVSAMAGKTYADIFTYGIEQEADLTAANIEPHGLQGLSLDLVFHGEAHRVHSPLLGEFSAYTILRAAAVALKEGLEWEAIKAGIAASHINLRMRQFTSPNGAVILDDTYNASPASTTAALKLLGNLEGRRIAILGDMLELGSYERSGHANVGIFAAKIADILILVGERSRTIAESAIETGFPEKHIHWYPTAIEAKDTAEQIIQTGDVVLIKGSNSMHMDQIAATLGGKS